MPIWLLALIEVVKFIVEKILAKKRDPDAPKPPGLLERIKEKKAEKKAKREGVGSAPDLV